jgi:nitrate/nitrite transport system substrate-binding protein
VQIRVTPPPEMVANLRAGNIDGFLGPDPFNQRAVYDEVGFIHILSKEIWDGHPCCAFGTSDRVHQAEPQHLRRAVPRRADRRRDGREPKNRELIAKVIAPGLPEPARDGAGAGADRQVRRRPGQRQERARPRRLRPVPWQSMAVWMLTQMKRWGYIKGDVNYKQIAEKVFLLTDAKKQMALEKPPKAPTASSRSWARSSTRPSRGLCKSFAISKRA